MTRRSGKILSQVLIALAAVTILAVSLGTYLQIRARELDHDKAQTSQQEQARAAYDDVIRSETESRDLELLVRKCDRCLRICSGTDYESDVRRRRDAYVRRIDERDI